MWITLYLVFFAGGVYGLLRWIEYMAKKDMEGYYPPSVETFIDNKNSQEDAMLANWINLLPLFIVKRLSRKYGQFVFVGNTRYTVATEGVLVKWEPK